MKKLLVLSLLASFAQAHCNTESTAQEQSNIVQLTEEEKVLCKEITADWRSLTNLAKEYKALRSILQMGCGLSQYNGSDKYNSNEYPKCKQVLEFLKLMHQQLEEQNKKYLECVAYVQDSQGSIAFVQDDQGHYVCSRDLRKNRKLKTSFGEESL